MSEALKHHPYALRIPAADAKELAKARKLSGESINQLVVLCVRKALPEVLAGFSRNRRVTNIEPLPAGELRKIYSGRDELEGVTAKQLASFQSQKAPE
jgi:hypothetical protein